MTGYDGVRLVLDMLFISVGLLWLAVRILERRRREAAEAAFEFDCTWTEDGADCAFCNGEACNLCGAGCWNPSISDCQHDSYDRHLRADPA